MPRTSRLPSSSSTARHSMIESLEGRQMLAGRVVGYLPEYRYSRLNHIDFSALTHINYFSVSANGDGSLATGNINLSHLDTAVAKAHANGVTMSITVGPQSFQTVTSNPTAMANFVANIVDFSEDHDLDGIDIDWEPPATGANKTRYGQLIDALYAQAQPRGLMLSAAVNPINTEIPVAAIEKLDWVAIMGYDFDPANHSPYTSSVNSLGRWHNYGAAKDKLVLGVPFYGRTGTTWSNTTSLTYAGILSNHLAVHGTLPSPDADFSEGYYYNGPTTIARKAQFVVDNNYGGVMIWELGQDRFTSAGTYDDYSLLPIIKSVIKPTHDSIINSIAATPAAGSFVSIGDTRAIEVDVNARLNEAGVMQVSLLDAGGNTLSTSWSAVTAGSETRRFSLTAPARSTVGAQAYTISVRIRPGAASGPIAGEHAGDVARVQPYSLTWRVPPDTTPPTMLASKYEYEKFQGVSFTPSEPLLASSISVGDLAIRRLSDNVTLTPSSFTHDSATGKITFRAGVLLSDGVYRATLAAGSIADTAGNGLAAAHSYDFVILTGDGDGDGVVDFDDLLRVAQNFDQFGKTYVEGNYNYSGDGSVNFGDLLIVTQRYGMAASSLFAARSIAASSVAAAPPTASKRQRVVSVVA